MAYCANEECIHTSHQSPFQQKIFSFLSLVTDQAYDGFHWAGSQWKGWRDRCKGKNGSSMSVSAKENCIWHLVLIAAVRAVLATLCKVQFASRLVIT